MNDKKTDSIPLNLTEKTSQKIQNLDEEQAEFMAVIAHQLRSPLATIRLVHQTLLENELNNLTEEQIHLLQQAEKRAKRIYDVTAELLKADDTLSPERAFEPKLGSIEQLIDEIVAELSVSLNAKELSLTCVYSDSPALVLFDKSTLSDAIMNLLDNAISYTPSGGAISVTTEYTPENITLYVTDTGVGVDEKDIGALFKKFNRLTTSKANHPNGLGLGLYIAQKVIEDHKGSISYQPNQPQGATFVIMLPV